MPRRQHVPGVRGRPAANAPLVEGGRPRRLQDGLKGVLEDRDARRVADPTAWEQQQRDRIAHGQTHYAATLEVVFLSFEKGMDETISNSLLSATVGILVGTTLEALMPAYRVSSVSVAELAFESAVQIAMLSVVLHAAVPWKTLVSTNGMPFGMALVAAQPGLNAKLSQLAVEVKQNGFAALQRRAQPVAAAPKATP